MSMRNRGKNRNTARALSKATKNGGRKHKQINESKPFKRNGEVVSYLKGASQVQRLWVSKIVFTNSFDKDGQELVNFLKHLRKTMLSNALTSCSWTPA